MPRSSLIVVVVVVVVVIFTLTRMIKSGVTRQAPITLQWKNLSRQENKRTSKAVKVSWVNQVVHQAKTKG